MVLLALAATGVRGGRSAEASGGNYVNTDVLNLRDDSGVWGNVITQMYSGDGFTVLDGPTDDGWYYIEYNGSDGWAYGSYLIIGGKRGWHGAAPSVGGDTSAPPQPEKWIDVNRSNWTVTLYEGDAAIATYDASLGYDTSDQGYYATATGTYYIFDKDKSLHWTTLGKVYIEDWMGFDPERSNGFHSWSLDADGNVLPNGAGKTGGCIALEPDVAAYVYDWTPMGTRVEVHW